MQLLTLASYHVQLFLAPLCVNWKQNLDSNYVYTGLWLFPKPIPVDITSSMLKAINILGTSYTMHTCMQQHLLAYTVSTSEVFSPNVFSSLNYSVVPKSN